MLCPLIINLPYEIRTQNHAPQATTTPARLLDIQVVSLSNFSSIEGKLGGDFAEQCKGLCRQVWELRNSQDKGPVTTCTSLV